MFAKYEMTPFLNWGKERKVLKIAFLSNYLFIKYVRYELYKGTNGSIIVMKLITVIRWVFLKS